MIKCLDAEINARDKVHVLYIQQTENNTGLFGSKVKKQQFEKIEDALSKKYIKFPFGIRVLI